MAVNRRALRTGCCGKGRVTVERQKVKLIDYIHRQRQCKLSVPLSDRTAELNSYPRFNDWLDIVNVRKEVVQPSKVLDGTAKVVEEITAITMQCLWRWATARAAESTDSSEPVTLRRVRGLGCDLAGLQRIPEELTLDALLEMNESKVKETMKRCGARDEECSRLNGALSCLRKVTESGAEPRDDVPLALPERRDSSCPQPDPACPPCAPGKGGQPRSAPCEPCPAAEALLEPLVLPAGRPRAPHSITVTPPATPQPKRRHRLKPPRTPPPPCRKVFQLLPNFPALTRSKSHESQLGNRIDEVPPIKPTGWGEVVAVGSELSQGSPQTVRRDFGLAVTHRFSTKSWLSQICQVCQKSMMFGVKLTKIRRTESVPSDINNPVDRPTEPQFGTLPKALTKKVRGGRGMSRVPGELQ
ncbi:hypothetical protein EK904_006299 [Melospiza melodia maxima]|nr:hypothetical protein EK904_006299 [Melospiza melodia maxima]